MSLKIPEEQSLLTKEECLLISEKVLKLRNNWINRGGFYTLGAASYLDMGEEDQYTEYKSIANPILQEEFRPIYEKIKNFFQAKLGKPVKFDLAWPGFHIFEFNEEMAELANLEYLAAIHVDRPHKDHNWEGIEIKNESSISFTIPIRIPKSGAGLNYFDIETDEDYINFYEASEELQEELVSAKKRIEYHTGNIYSHSFGFLHQISNDSPLQQGDMRITIQGHGVLCNDEYYTFFF